MGRKTYCVANMKFTDVTALSDASVSAGDNRSIGSLALFQNETEVADYGTLELNQFVLDGTKEIMTERPEDIAFLSNTKSDSDCNFAENPQIVITFTETHTSAGITLYFGKYYPAEIGVTWYTLSGIKLESKIFYPDKETYFCKHQVQNYGKIVITFRRTRFPDMYARAQYILYGVELMWADDLVKSAKLREELDLTSATLAINTAEISILDENNDFDIGNEDGAWKSVQKIQEVSLKEYVNGTYKNVGTFFVDSMSFKDNEATFGLIDRIGLMDKYQYASERIFAKEKAGIILMEIFARAGITKYLISEDIFNIELSGYLPKQTCREALQMVCFMCGAVADDSRSDTISVYKPDRYVSAYIGTDRKLYGNSKVELDEYVSGVQIEYNRYVLDADVKEIFKEELPIGDTKVEFSEPYDPASLILSTGIIKAATTDYVIVTMTETAECVVSGKKYSANKLRYSRSVDRTEPGETENIKKFGTCTLYNPEQLAVIAEYLLNYYKLRKKVELRYLLVGERVGNWVNVRDMYGKTATTAIEFQEIDLAGGYLATASCRGYSIVVTANYYTGTELYSGGGVLL